MNITKECQICKSKIAKYSCAACGNYVCEVCFDKNKMICNNCKGGKR
jgi:hypothetical protein